MYTHVLVPFDFSNDAQYAVRCLAQIPNLRRVVLLHVVYTRYPQAPGEPPDPAVDYARLRMDEFTRTLGWRDVRVENRIEAITGGEISAVVNRVAASEGTSLVVMGRKGMGVIETLLLGSVASDVLKRGDRDLLLVRAPGPDAGGIHEKTASCPPLFSHVMVCTDFSEPDIIPLAREALPFASDVTLLHVVASRDQGEAVHLMASDAWTRLKGLRDAYGSAVGPVRATVCEGDPGEEIVRHAAENRVSLIVMKSTGRKGFIRDVLGSTTTYVARNAHVPVLVLKRFGPVK